MMRMRILGSLLLWLARFSVHEKYGSRMLFLGCFTQIRLDAYKTYRKNTDICDKKLDNTKISMYN